MKIGLTLPNLTPLGTRENILTFAREAERLGYDSLWVTERLLFPVQPLQQMRGGPWPEIYKFVLDPLDTLVFAAGVTEKIRLGTSVLDFPFYTPARLAKRIATLDVLSGGRATIGAGLGWSEDEFIASDKPFNQRVGRFNEMIQALNILWGPDPVEFHGRYFNVPASFFNPKPLQKPRPPILVGGFSEAGQARAAKFTDGFNPIFTPNAAQVEAFIISAKKAWHDAEREPAKPIIVGRVNHGFVSAQPINAERKFLTGSVEQVRGDIHQLEDWGVDGLFFNPTSHFYQLQDGFKQVMDQINLLRGVV
jgi:probable F420-dependent oxidoreductase